MLFPLILIFLAGFAVVVGFMPIELEERPTLHLKMEDPLANLAPRPQAAKKNKPTDIFLVIFSKFAIFNKPLAVSGVGRRVYRDMRMAKSSLSVEEFFLIKELLIVLLLFLGLRIGPKDFIGFIFLFSVGAGYMLPELWLKARIKKIKEDILRNLPDTVDLLGLCVNAGLDFMMALKYVVEKSAPTAIIDELQNMMQEIQVGKPRRDALRDLARKYELADLSTFSRTLIQADRMGTSVIEALNILSEDMREARFRRGESMALKAPLKMLVPLLFFIFPVVAILVAGPVFLDFFQNNPLKNLAH
jgi:pilus assembly protein TadC